MGLHPPSLASLQSHSADDDRSIDLGGVGGKDDRAARGRAEGTGGTVRNEQQTEHRSNLATAAEEEEEEIRFPSFHPKREAGGLIELEWPGPPSPCPTGQIEPASATVDDPLVQLGMCTYTLSSTFAMISHFLSGCVVPSSLARTSTTFTNPRR